MARKATDRDRARKAFARARITYAEIDEAALLDLRDRLDAALRASGLIDGTYRMRRVRPVWEGTVAHPWAALRCRSRYFASREAVTFNPEGFVGFAGWADDDNVVPVLKGFLEWVDAMVARRAARAA